MLATQLIVELTGARWTGHTDVQGDLPERPLVRLPPGACRRRSSGSRCRRRAARAARAARLRARGRRLRRVPTWRARDVTREIDVVEEVARFRLADVPFTLPLRRAMTGRLTPRAAPAPAARGRARRRSASPRCTRRRCGPTTATRRDRLPEPISMELAVLRTGLLPSLVDVARRNVEAGNRSDRPVRDRARLPAAGSELPDEPLHVAGIVEGGFAARERRRRGALRGAQGDAGSSSPPSTRSCTPARRRAPRPASRRAASRRARGQLGRLRARPRRAARRRARAGARTRT